jgi:hypothetical protein
MGDWWRRADLGEPMNHTTPERGRSDPATPAPFADLVAELGELGFEPQPGPAIPGQVVYAATDSPVTITVVTHPTHPHLRAESAADGHAWHLDWTNHTPVHVQLIALYESSTTPRPPPCPPRPPRSAPHPQAPSPRSVTPPADRATAGCAGRPTRGDQGGGRPAPIHDTGAITRRLSFATADTRPHRDAGLPASHGGFSRSFPV